MCGIAGVIGEPRDLASLRVQRMMSALSRRGPDGEGVSCWDDVVLGHRRLAIFDLSQAGRQPMVTPDRSIGVVFNGAIYNFRDLRAQLVSDDYQFVSQTDTEVLLHGYLKWGIDGLVGKLRGMFAFALWDDRTKTLYLVRDRLGVKPLAYTVANGVLAFASTVRALSVAGFAGRLDGESIGEFLHSGFLADDRSIYRDVRKVPAASIVQWSRGSIAVRRYWAPPDETDQCAIRFGDAVEQAKERILESVRLRLQADVPVGALLSGGIDSTLVCWAVQKLGADIQAYTVGTPGDVWDETTAAKATAHKLGLKHCIVEMPQNFIPDIDEVVSAYAEPFGSASALGMLRVSRAIAETNSVKVLLTGEGGDDVFLGYPRHRNLWLASKLSRRLPEVATRWWRGRSFGIPRTRLLRRANALLQYTSGGLAGVVHYSRSQQVMATSGLLGERFDALPAGNLSGSLRNSGRTVLTDFLQYELGCRFVGEYMTKVDGATMHYGIEARAPFLDHCLWEFAASIPYDVRLHRGRLKAVLRRIVRDEIWPDIAKRPKRGFGIPVQRWVLHRWRPWVEQLLRESVLERERWLKPGAALEQLAVAAKAGEAPAQLWYAIVLEAWLRHEQGMIT